MATTEIYTLSLHDALPISRNTKTTRLSRRSNVHKNKKAGAPPKGSSGLFVYEGNTG